MDITFILYYTAKFALLDLVLAFFKLSLKVTQFKISMQYTVDIKFVY